MENPLKTSVLITELSQLDSKLYNYIATFSMRELQQYLKICLCMYSMLWAVVIRQREFSTPRNVAISLSIEKPIDIGAKAWFFISLSRNCDKNFCQKVFFTVIYFRIKFLNPLSKFCS